MCLNCHGQEWNDLSLALCNRFICKSPWNELASNCKQGKKEVLFWNQILPPFLSFPMIPRVYSSQIPMRPAWLRTNACDRIFCIVFFLFIGFSKLFYSFTHRPQINNHFSFLKVSEVRKYVLVNMLSFLSQNVNVINGNHFVIKDIERI